MRNLSYESEFCMQFHFHANLSDFHNIGSISNRGTRELRIGLILAGAYSVT